MNYSTDDARSATSPDGWNATGPVRAGPAGSSSVVRPTPARHARVRLVFNFINCIARTTRDCAAGIWFGERSPVGVNTISGEVVGARRPTYYKILGTLSDKLGADSARHCGAGRRSQIALGELYSALTSAFAFYPAPPWVGESAMQGHSLALMCTGSRMFSLHFSTTSIHCLQWQIYSEWDKADRA